MSVGIVTVDDEVQQSYKLIPAQAGRLVTNENFGGLRGL